MAKNLIRQRVQRSAAQWKALFEAQSLSGLSQQAFCERNSISLGAFYNARSRLGRRDTPSASMSHDDFVALTLPAQADPGGWDIELSLGADVVLRIRRS